MPLTAAPLRFPLACLIALSGLLTAQEAALPKLRGLSRLDLLEVRQADGRLTRATTPGEWAPRAQEAVAGFVSVTGPLPGEARRGDLAPQILEETDCGSYLRRLISYAAEPQSRVPAYLCLPKQALQGRPAPAVLCLHPTENQIGHQVVVGLGGKPNRQYAAELAERGFVTLSPAYPQLANYQPDLAGLGYQSGTMKAIWDNLRGVDYLETLPFVDAKPGFGVIGHSLGGHNAVYTAVYDVRLKVIVSSCGLDSFLDYKGGNLSGWTQNRYMPRMAAFLGQPERVPFDFDELLALLAPRWVFISAPLHDSNFRHTSVARLGQATRAVFDLHQAGDHLQIHHPDSDHDFPEKERFLAYELFEAVLMAPAEPSVKKAAAQ
jgi:dienelactone hydrolase